jgi:integrase/recombinase XerD
MPGFADVVPGFFDYLIEERGLRPAQLLAELLGSSTAPMQADAPVFRSATGQALTRFGIYKRSCGATPGNSTTLAPSAGPARTPSCHTEAVHLLEAGVEVNVIRGWLGHADLTTTNRYARGDQHQGKDRGE